MHEHKVVAKLKGKVVGEKVVKNADTWEECPTIAGSKERARDLFNQAWNTSTRNAMARPVGEGAIAKKLERFNKCISVGIDRAKALLVAELTEVELKDALAGTKAA